MKALLYCTKGSPYLVKNRNGVWEIRKEKSFKDFAVNGLIVAKCDIPMVEEIIVKTADETTIKGLRFNLKTKSLSEQALLDKIKLSQHELLWYLGFDNGYAIYLENVDKYNMKPLLFEKDYIYKNAKGTQLITKAPQNMCYCYDRFGHKYVLISIRPEDLEKILNGKKTIEARKQILKEMKDLMK